MLANNLVVGGWTETVGTNAPLIAHTVLRAAPIAAAVVEPGDDEVVVVGRPMGSRRDCARTARAAADAGTWPPRLAGRADLATAI
jgi:hypothetical protein